MRKTHVLLLALIAVIVLAAGTSAQPISLVPYITTGLARPVFMTSARDGTHRNFIVEQGGFIKVVQPGSTSPTIFLDVSARISTNGNERGLLGLAFHPQYETNRRFFIYYSVIGSGSLRIAEYQTLESNPNVADTVEKEILTIPHPGASNHNGGTVAFGPDGFLYAGPGDGGGGNDTQGNAQNIDRLLGKILRIDVDNIPAEQTRKYNIPPTNPYAGATAGADEIFAIGMRNPYRFSFDRGGTNQLWAADVGQGAIEEVDIITLGGNYGWRAYEGSVCTGLEPNMCTGGVLDINEVPPVLEYDHSGGKCSVTGGYVYRGSKASLPVGGYVFADFCSGEIFLWNNNAQTVLLDTGTNISGFAEDEAGEVYVIGLGGSIERIVGPTISIAGTLRRIDGIPIRNVPVSISSPGGVTQNFISDSAGAFRFSGLAKGVEHTILVRSKQYRFQPQRITAVDHVSGFDIIGRQ